MSYQYTYDTYDDYAGFENLTDEARTEGGRINRLARRDGADRHELLCESSATPEVKAALAEVWGGPGAGKEFLP